MSDCHHHASEEVLSSSKTIKCPVCNYEFSLYYARAVACEGCPLTVRGCENVRCPRCDNEFSLNALNISNNKTGSRHMGQYMSKLLSQYYEEFGESPSR
jgi:uncharacterized protein (DUF2225 family)